MGTHTPQIALAPPQPLPKQPFRWKGGHIVPESWPPHRRVVWGGDLGPRRPLGATAAFLLHAELGEAQLEGANLSGVNLMGRCFEGCDLTGANFSKVWGGKACVSSGVFEWYDLRMKFGEELGVVLDWALNFKE